MASLAYQDLPLEVQQRSGVQHFIDAIRGINNGPSMRPYPWLVSLRHFVSCGVWQRNLLKVRLVDEMEKEVDRCE